MSLVLLDTTIVVGPAASVAVNAGNGQSATVGTAVAVALSVIVKDADGNGVSGETVTFTVTGGGGSITGGTQVTDTNGIATLPSWTLGTAAGSNTIVAAAGEVGSVTFTATGTAGTASRMTFSSPISGAGNAGLASPYLPTVLVTDQYGNPKSGASVTFAVTGGGGSATGLSQTSDATGQAQVTSWTLGGTPAVNVLEATASLTGSPVDFFVSTFTAFAGGPSSVAATRSFRSWEPQIVAQRAAANAASSQVDGRAPEPHPLPTRVRVGKPAPSPVGAEFIPAATTLKGIR